MVMLKALPTDDSIGVNATALQISQSGKSNSTNPGQVSVLPISLNANPELWSYTGRTGPENWATLSPNYTICAIGKLQSPINVFPEKNAKMEQNVLTGVYSPIETHNGDDKYIYYPIINSGSANSANSSNHIIHGSKSYDMYSVGLKAPSEHYLENKEYPLEIQINHKNNDGTWLNIGVLVEIGNHTSDFIAMYFKNQGIQLMAFDGILRDLDEYSLTYRYSGSMTVPPCTESVTWFITYRKLSITATDLQRFDSVMGRLRPLQRYTSSF